MEFQLTLFQPGVGGVGIRADYANQIAACPHGLENLTTSLNRRLFTAKFFIGSKESSNLVKGYTVKEILEIFKTKFYSMFTSDEPEPS